MFDQQSLKIYLLQGHFPLCSHGAQEDQLDPDTHLYHLFQVAQLVLGGPITRWNINNMVKIV